MANKDDLTFMEKIVGYRPYAHRPSSTDSDQTHSSQKSRSANDSENQDLSEDLHDQQPVCSCHDQPTYSFGSDETNMTSSAIKADTTDKKLQITQATTSSDSETEITNINVGASGLRGGDIQMQERQTSLKDQDGLQAGQLFYIDETTKEISTFTSFDELSQHLLKLKNCSKRDTLADELTKTFVHVSAQNVVNHVAIGEYLKRLHSKNMMIDVIVDVRGEKFPAHRVVLCCHSIYFNNLFSQNKSNKIPCDLKIKGISADSFASFLEFCYTGEINVYPEIAADLLILSDYLQVVAIRERCAAITDTLPVDQALKFIVNTKANQDHKIYKSLYHRVLTLFSGAAKFDEFLEMDIETLCKLLASDELVIQSEVEVFNAAVRWIAHNVEDRVKYIMRLMLHVRFCHMKRSELMQCVETTSLVRAYDKFREVVLIANWQRMSLHLGRDDPFGFPTVPKRLCFTYIGEQPVATSSSRPKSVLPTPVQPILMLPGASKPPPTMDILMIGRYIARDSTSNLSVERYDISNNQWTSFCEFPAIRKDHAVVASMGKVYVIGGCERADSEQDLRVVQSLYALDLQTQTWTRKADMFKARYSHCACAAHDKLYVIGGKDQEQRVMKSVECYDPQTDSWTYISAMNSARYAACAASFVGNIIVVGGIGESDGASSQAPVLNTVEIYNIEKESWRQGNNLRHPRCHANLVQSMGRLYLCCGAARSYNVQSSVLISVASLDQYDFEEDEWCHVADMVIPRHDAGVVAAGDKLFIMGGVSTVADRALQSVECFNTTVAKWESGLQDLPMVTGSAGCVTVPTKPELGDYSN